MCLWQRSALTYLTPHDATIVAWILYRFQPFYYVPAFHLPCVRSWRQCGPPSRRLFITLTQFPTQLDFNWSANIRTGSCELRNSETDSSWQLFPGHCSKAIKSSDNNESIGSGHGGNFCFFFLFVVDWFSSQLSLLQMRQLGMIDGKKVGKLREIQKLKLLLKSTVKRGNIDRFSSVSSNLTVFQNIKLSQLCFTTKVSKINQTSPILR